MLISKSVEPEQTQELEGRIADPRLTRDICEDHAYHALVAHARNMCVNFEHGEEAVVDLLTNLRHYADAHSVDFFAALDTSYQHYLAEKKGVL